MGRMPRTQFCLWNNSLGDWLRIILDIRYKLDILLTMNTFLTNPYVFLISVIWISCASATIFTKKNDVFVYAFWMTMFIGLGYLLAHNH